MCNLYTMRASADQIAEAFKAKMPANTNAGTGEVYPGGQALVVRQDGDERVVQQMTWGFPLRLKTMKPESKPKPVNNIADLDGYMWKFIAHKPEHRCLIPVSGFCEAEGEKGAKTRTWFGLKEQPLFAWAGMWKESVEWGAVFSGLMTGCNELVAPVHNRMPVLLHANEIDEWLECSLDDVRRFQGRCFPADLMTIERTAEPWFRRTVGATG